MKQCGGRSKLWNKRCEGVVPGGSGEFCYMHDPKLADERMAWTRMTAEGRREMGTCLLELREAGLTLQEIAGMCGRSQERIRQLVAEAQEREARMR